MDRVDFPKGEPENPLTDEEFKGRYDGLMAYACVKPVICEKVFSDAGKDSTKITEVIMGL